MKPPSSPQPIATRRSPLALVQARDVQARLIAACGLDAEEGERLFPILGLVSTGDRIQCSVVESWFTNLENTGT